MRTLFLLAMLAAAEHSFALPSLGRRQQEGVACTDLSAPIDPSCYEALDISTWLINWNKTTPQCQGNTDVNCCVRTEPWSNCFLRLAQGKSGPVCNYLSNTVDADTKCDPSQWKPVVDPSIAGQVRYVGFNLFSK